MVKTTVFSALLLVGVIFAVPTQAHAIEFNPFNPIDPFCLFSCNNEPDQNIDNSINNSFNTQTNINSNNRNVQNNYGTNNTNTQNNVATPAYVYTSGGTTYQTPPLAVSCYPINTQILEGGSVVWRASVSGGNGNYNITWTGTDGLSGYGESISKTYSSSGSKSASIRVISGTQTVSQNCSGAVLVERSHQYDYDYTPTYNYTTYYPTPTYYPTYPTYPTYYPLSVTCRANTTYAQPGSSVYWVAYASGGTGSYSYTWTGTDSLYGSGSSASAYYNTPGTKTAWVTVYSGGQQSSVQCSNFVTVNQTYYQQPVQQYYQPVTYGNGLQIACAADTTSTKVNVPVTWTAEATFNGYSTGGLSYSWSGSEVYGSQPSAIVRYSNTGTKSAWVTVTAPGGQNKTMKCSNSVYVAGNTVAKAVVAKEAPASPAPIYIMPPQQPAGALFSLNNVPWGGVAVLIILVLMGIVAYLLFNKRKI